MSCACSNKYLALLRDDRTLFLYSLLSVSLIVSDTLYCISAGGVFLVLANCLDVMAAGEKEYDDMYQFLQYRAVSC